MAVRFRFWVISRPALAGALAGALALSLAAGALAHRISGAPAAGPAPVMIDPGHGGVDGGTGQGTGVLEKEVTLDVGLRLRRHLEAEGIPVEMTRDQDADLGGGFDSPRGRHRRDLTARARRTRECGAAILVSLHANATTDPAETGMMFFYQKDNAAGLDLARALQSALQPLHARREAPIGRTNLFLLRNCQIPAVIVELGFLTNPQDRARLADPEYREAVARAMAGSVAAFYRRLPGSGKPPQ